MTNYNPVPTRVWSRVENSCVYSPQIFNDGLFYSKLTNTYLPQPIAAYETQMILKGNILQYRNSYSNLTKKQKYSKIANGNWIGKKSYATQSITYTNPNTTGLQRVNYIDIPPNTIVSSQNNPSGPFQTGILNPDGCSTNNIAEGGTLVGNTFVNPCTGEIIKKTQNVGCFPTSCSNVPGKQTFLCWNNSIPTWNPRKRYTMSNSSNKWPINYNSFVSALNLVPPTLTGNLNSDNSVTLNWSSTSSSCVQISNWNIFNNNTLIENIAYPITSTTIYDLTQGNTYSFYVVSVNNNINSPPSNTYTITIPSLQPL
jgi:hypothetical protein